jgi:hypothetical protein
MYVDVHVLQLISRRASLPHGRHVTFVCIEHSLTAAGACLAGLALHCWPCPVCTTHSATCGCCLSPSPSVSPVCHHGLQQGLCPFESREGCTNTFAVEGFKAVPCCCRALLGSVDGEAATWR